MENRTCAEIVECIKGITPAFVLVLIVIGCVLGIGIILITKDTDYAPYLDKLVGTLMVIAGLQQ